MAITIDRAFIQTYEDNVRHLAQQTDSRLRSTVMEKNRQSESHNWDRLAASDPRLKPNARAQSPAGGSGSGAIDTTDGLAWTRRKTLIQTWDWGEIVAPEEIAQMLIDPTSSVTVNGAMAMKRAVDDVIITNATGDALDGNGTPVVFPAGNQIGTGIAPLSLSDLLTIQEMFGENDVDPDEPRYLVINPAMQHALLLEEKLTSYDYQQVKALSTGYIDNCLGFHRIILSNRLLAGIGAGDTSRLALAYTEKALGLHVAQDITAKVAERPDMSFEIQVYLHMSMDAVRVEDARIFAIDALNAAA